jgi:hypothetical protein
MQCSPVPIAIEISVGVCLLAKSQVGPPGPLSSSAHDCGCGGVVCAAVVGRRRTRRVRERDGYYYRVFENSWGAKNSKVADIIDFQKIR